MTMFIYVLGGNLNYSAKQRERMKLSHPEWVLTGEDWIFKHLTRSVYFKLGLDFIDISCSLDFFFKS